MRAITPLPVTSDPALLIYNSVRALNPRATTILTSGAGPIVYDNMATFGFQVPNGAAGVSLDAVGQTGTAQGGQVVLVTMEAGNASGATVRTDKDDYAPGDDGDDHRDWLAAGRNGEADAAHGSAPRSGHGADGHR